MLNVFDNILRRACRPPPLSLFLFGQVHGDSSRVAPVLLACMLFLPAVVQVIREGEIRGTRSSRGRKQLRGCLDSQT